jgi:MFS transporter, ACS family, D-galactonate transporter
MRYYVLSLLCLAAVIAYVQRLAFAVCEEHIRTDLLLDKPQIGQIMAAWQLGYALMQLPSGWLADRIGARISISLFIVSWSGLLGLTTWCNSHQSLIVVWGLMGMAQAGVFPCSTKLIGQWFGSTQRASASGLLASSMSLGIALAPLLTTQMLAADISWRSIFLSFVIPGWLWAGVFITTTKSNTAQSVAAQPSGAIQVSQPALRWTDFLTNVSLWLLCGQQFFRAAAMMFFQSWFPTFLRETRGVDLVGSGKLAFIVGIAAMLGGMSGGLFSDWLLVRTGNRRIARQGIAVFGMLSCAALIAGSYFISNTTIAIGCISLGAFLATFGGISGYTVAIELGGRAVATTFSIMNMCGNIGAALFPLAVGYLSDSRLGWDGVLFLCVIILIIDAYCWAILNPLKTITGESLANESIK